MDDQRPWSAQWQPLVIIVLLPQLQISMNVTGAMISIESHTKQIKLLNDYILSLEKKLADKKDEPARQNISEEIRKFNEDNNKLRNENAQLRYNAYKFEESTKKMGGLEAEAGVLKNLLEKERKDKSQLLAQNNFIATRLQNCEAHLQAAEREIQNRTEVFERDAKLMAADLEELKNQLAALSTEHSLLRDQKNYFDAKLRETESSLSQATKSKNEAILKLSQAHEELKAKLSQEIAVSNNKKDSYSNQLRDLVNQLNESRSETLAARKEAFQLKTALDKKNEENQTFASRLVLKSQEYENAVRLNNDQKTNLIRIIRRLQQQKKNVQNLHNSVKGDASEQAKLRSQMMRKNEGLSSELTETSKQLSQTRTQLQNILYLKQQVEGKLETLNTDYTNLKLMRDEAEVKRREMEETNQNLLKDFFNSKSFFEHTAKSLEQTVQKKNKLIVELQQKVTQLQSQMLHFRNNSDNSSRDFIAYRNTKESQISVLNAKISEAAKQQTALKESAEALKQQYQFYQKKKEAEIQELSNRLKDLQKQHFALKDSNDLVTREHYTLQKKSEADVYSLNERIKEQTKKIEKKEQKIGELEEELKKMERVHSNSRKNNDQSQKQELERIRSKFERERLELAQLLNEERAKAEQLASDKLLALKQVQQLEVQARAAREQLRTKERTSAQAIKHLQRERLELFQQVKSLGLSVTLTSQSKSSQELQVEALKRSIVHLQNYSGQQRKSIESLTKLLSQKQSQVESLQNSNAMLRKQVIASINNEQISRKQALDVRSKATSGAATSRARGATSRKTTYSQLGSKQGGRFAESIVNGVDSCKTARLVESTVGINLGVTLADELSSMAAVRGDDRFSERQI